MFRYTKIALLTTALAAAGAMAHAANAVENDAAVISSVQDKADRDR